MKKITLLFGLLILVSTISVEANSTNKTNLKIGNYGRYHQRPVTFVERNVKFYIYQNGDLDFDINSYQNGYYGASDNYNNYGNRKSNSRSRNTKKHHSDRYYGHHSDYIQYDYYGRAKRIGSTFIHYDYYGKVIAINAISISYRHHRLYRVGNLRIIVDRYGHTRYIGSVKPRHYHYQSYYNDYFYNNYIYNYEDDFFYNDDFEDDYDFFDEDDDFYYYRSKDKHTKRSKNGRKEMKQKLIKRRKPTNEKRKNS
jgi:hypothetical protein